jgi:Rieske Fe-S protein
VRSEQGSQAKWREDFPIHWEEDEYVTRREFTRFLGLTSFALFLGTAWIAVWERLRRRPRGSRTAQRIASTTEMPLGEVKLFRYPTTQEPCILIRLAQDRFVAYSQLCTHLACPVVYEGEKQRLRCPCHEGYFSAEDGRPMAGPPKRPLPRIDLSVRGNEIWIGDRL